MHLYFYLGLSMILFAKSLNGTDFAIDQNKTEKSQELKWVNKLHAFDPSKLIEGSEVTYVDVGLTEYLLVSEPANQGWTLSLFDFSRTTSSHYHNLQNQLVMPLEGMLTVRLENQEIDLIGGQYAFVPKGAIHALAADRSGARFLILDMPGFDYPYDRLDDKALPQLEQRIAADEISSFFFVDQSIRLTDKDQRKLEEPFFLAPKYYKTKIEKEGLTVYPILCAEDADTRWSVALLEMGRSTLKDFHFQETQRLLVLNGEFRVRIGESEYSLSPGQSVRISGGTKFFLASSGGRLLCISHPGVNWQE